MIFSFAKKIFPGDTCHKVYDDRNDKGYPNYPGQKSPDQEEKH